MSEQTTAPTGPTTVMQLVEQIYADPTVALPAREVLGIGVTIDGFDEEIKVLKSRSTGDPFLDVPVRLLRTCAGVDPSSAIRERLIILARAALDASPVFSGLSAGLDGERGSVPLTAVRVSDAANDTPASSLGVEPETLKKERDRLRRNAITAFLLYRVLTQNWDLERVLTEAVAARLWPAPPGERSKTEVAMADLLVSRAPKALGLVGHTSNAILAAGRTTVRNAQAEAERDRRRALAAESLNRELRKDLARAEDLSEELRGQIAALQAELAQERKHRIADTSHHVSDYEVLRTKVMRNLNDQIELLDDGLHALRDGVTDVAEEFTERALGAIKAEAARLKGLGRSQ